MPCFSSVILSIHVQRGQQPSTVQKTDLRKHRGTPHREVHASVQNNAKQLSADGYFLHTTSLSLETLFQSQGILPVVSLPPILSSSLMQFITNQLIRMMETGLRSGQGDEWAGNCLMSPGFEFKPVKFNSTSRFGEEQQIPGSRAAQTLQCRLQCSAVCKGVKVRPGVAAHSYNPSTHEAEAEECCTLGPV